VALLEAGADPVPARGYLNLVWAVGTRRLDLVRRFLEAGAEPNVRALGGTPLRRAAALGEREMVKLLVEAGADLDALDDEGQSALALAQRFGHEEVSRVLREAGARARTERAPARRRGAARDPDAEREVAPERKAAARPPAPGLPSLKDLRRRYDRAQVVARLRSGCDGEAYLAAIAELEALCGSPRRDERDTLGGFSLHVPSGRELDLEALQERLLARGVLVFASETGARSGAAGRLVALPTRDRYDALAVMRTNGANEGQGPEHIIRWLLDRETTHPFVLTAVAFDTLRGRFLDPIGDPEELAQSMYELCSDVVERGTETVEALAELLAGTRQLLFWWD
jgi:hypothetical protein